MKAIKETLLILYLIMKIVICSNGKSRNWKSFKLDFFCFEAHPKNERLILVAVVVRDEYKGYPSKRLTNNVIKTVVTSSAFHCTTWCSMTDGCLAVNVIGNHDITCELTTGLSNENEMQEESSSQLFVSSKNSIDYFLQFVDVTDLV